MSHHLLLLWRFKAVATHECCITTLCWMVLLPRPFWQHHGLWRKGHKTEIFPNLTAHVIGYPSHFSVEEPSNSCCAPQGVSAHDINCVR